MAPIDLRLGQNAFQVIPELSLFDVEDQKTFRGAGAPTSLGEDSLISQSRSPPPNFSEKHFDFMLVVSFLDVEDRKFFGFSGLDHFVLAGTHASWLGHMCLGQDTCVPARTN